MRQGCEEIMIEFPIRGEYITLGQLLKALGVVGAGSDVKQYLAEQAILVNGVRDERRGRKLYGGDQVTVPGDESVRLVPYDHE